AQALQGQHHGGGTALAALALSAGRGDLRGRLCVPPEGRRGLHPPERAPSPHPGPPRPGPSRDISVIDVALTPEEVRGLPPSGVTPIVLAPLPPSPPTPT